MPVAPPVAWRFGKGGKRRREGGGRRRKSRKILGRMWEGSKPLAKDTGKKNTKRVNTFYPH